MKTFSSLRENLNEKKLRSQGVDAMIKKVGSKYQVKIDNEVLDTYNSEKEAMKMAKEFIKQYKG